MSYDLWLKMPRGFLKMGHRSFYRLDGDVQRLIIKLADDQNFRCAFCIQKHSLEIEHEHEAKERVPYSVYNVRGLVCRNCNWQLMAYEQKQRGEGIAWENHSGSSLSSSQYRDYIDAFECRVRQTHEDLLEKRMGHHYWKRKFKLDMLDRRYQLKNNNIASPLLLLSCRSAGVLTLSAI